MTDDEIDKLREAAADHAQAVVDAVEQHAGGLDTQERVLAMLYAASATMKASGMALSFAVAEFVHFWEHVDCSLADKYGDES